MSRRRATIWLSGAALIVLAIVVVLVVRGHGSTESLIEPPAADTPSPSVSPVPVKTPASKVEPSVVAKSKNGSEIVTPPVAAVDQALLDPAVPVDLGEIAARAALVDINSQTTEFVREGLHQVGSVKVKSAKVLKVREKKGRPVTAVVRVCLDRSDVKVLDADGKDMSNPEAAPRVRQLWTMESTESGWKLVDRTFDNKLTC